MLEAILDLSYKSTNSIPFIRIPEELFSEDIIE